MPAPMTSKRHAAAMASDTRNASSPRYYADISQPFAYEPTRERIRVIRTHDGKGDGLQAVTDFQQGDIVFSFTGPVMTEQTLYTLQIEPGKYLSDPLVMGKVLHACDPNMECDMRTLTFTARRDIAAGEMLTMDYETTEDELFRPFFCGCGAASCRGWIRGRAVRDQ